VALSRDEHLIVSISDDETVRVWDANNGQELRCFDIKCMNVTERVYAVAFSRDGQQIVSRFGYGSVCAWSMATGELLDTSIAAGLAQRELGEPCLTNGGMSVFAAGADGCSSIGFTCESTIEASAVSADGSFVALFDKSGQLCTLELVQRKT
jgi:WD40 repeat protein